MFTAYARNSVLASLQQAIKIGYLEIKEGDQVYRFGSSQDNVNSVHLTIVRDSFWKQLLFQGDLGFSEAYMIGNIELDSDTLGNVMDLWLDNQPGMASLNSVFKRLNLAVSGLSNAFFGQTPTQARLNVIESYDLSNELFKAFLSKEMMYSSALFSDEEGGVNGDLLSGSKDRSADLEMAQLRKIHYVLNRARVKPGQRVLEVGTGWGGFAIEAARTCGCEVDTLTLSIEQKRLAEERIREAGLQDLIRVHLMDYRDIPKEFEKKFDAFVSIEMVEHVGPKYYSTYFKTMDKALKSRDAAAVVTCTSRPELRYSEYQSEDFARKYMWPRTSIPSATVLINAVNTATQGRFTVERVENHSAHYARTCREWDKRFVANVTPEILEKDFPSIKTDPAMFEMLYRKWRYLFAYAEAGMGSGYVTCHMFTFIRPDDKPSE
ncbi:Mycolic acid cyclopropane synthetase-domain-containing protein [Lactifluus volemus]|nr:Mycolic acid cyclopropane synthetase-domain-containing protein [Lactifluus volemus]